MPVKSARIKQVKKAEAEFEKYRKDRDKKYISDFDREVRKIEKII